MRIAEHLAEALRRQGVRHAFLAAELPTEAGTASALLAALRAGGIEPVALPAGPGAALAAAATGELTGVPGVCVAAAGSAERLLPGVGRAWLDQAPLLALLVGPAPATDPAWRRLEPAAKLTATVTAASAPGTLARALDLASAEPCGPVGLALPDDALGQPVEVAADEPPDEPARPPLAAGEVARLAGRLSAARRPALWVGLGARHMEWEREIVDLAERLGGPVVVTPKAKGHFPASHRLYAGVCPAGGDAPLRELLSRADLLVGVGLDAAELPAPWPFLAPALCLTPGPERAGPPGAPTVRLDGQGGLAALAEGLAGRSQWPTDAAAGAREAAARRLSGAGEPLAVALRQLRAALRPAAVVASDGGACGAAVAQLWPAHWPRTYLTPGPRSASDGPSGPPSPGYALAAALAARLALPDREVACLVDGAGLPVLAGELAALARVGHTGHAGHFGHVGLGCVVVAWSAAGQADLPALARACGLRSAVASPAELGAATAAALAGAGPTLIELVE